LHPNAEELFLVAARLEIENGNYDKAKVILE